MSFRSVPAGRVIENSNKIAKKIQKIKKYHYGFSLSKNRLQKGRERENIKSIVPFRSYPMRYRKFQKSSKKFKNLKNTIMASFQAKLGWKRMRKRENKNYHYVSFVPEA